MSGVDIADTTLTFFQELLNHAFTVEVNHESLELELISADPLSSGPEGLDLERSFTLEFRGPAEPVLNQGTFNLSHPDLGDAPVFLVPVAAAEDGMRYLAVFNRLA